MAQGPGIQDHPELQDQFAAFLIARQDDPDFQPIERSPPARDSLEEAEQNSSRFEHISYRDVLDDFRRCHDVFYERYCFEDIKSYEVGPEDDLEEAIARHAKIKLLPGREYDISQVLNIKSCAYIIGNGAIIRVTGENSPAIKVGVLSVGPCISGMTGVTFVNCRFEREVNSRGLMIRASTHVLFHGCSFTGIMGTCIELGAGGYIRGCEFVGCYRGICSSSNRDVKVRQCHFDKCLLAITCKGDFRISGNVCSETFCFVHLEGEGLVKNNTVKSPCRWTSESGFSLITCADGRVTPLATVHIVGNRCRRWPTMQGNVFIMCKVYLGNRMGTLSLPQCAFYKSSICLEERAANKLVLACAFENNVLVYKVLRRESPSSVKMCVCGSSHYAKPLTLGIISSEVKATRYLYTVDSSEFTSDED
ncbi:E1B-55k [Deer mastadenovirus B]|uniref:E1B 55 kDa protein n=1 Tax=Deer mastadenovirus B TaxID=2170000 RepID=A0A1Y0B6G4_9ADEN|nr:E1B-55k [Deer mastadenovirus B]ART33360.1 E1B-55k [Deer mastadenovirus B]